MATVPWATRVIWSTPVTTQSQVPWLNPVLENVSDVIGVISPTPRLRKSPTSTLCQVTEARMGSDGEGLGAAGQGQQGGTFEHVAVTVPPGVGVGVATGVAVGVA